MKMDDAAQPANRIEFPVDDGARPRSRRALWVGLALLVAVVAAVLFWRSREATPAAAAGPAAQPAARVTVIVPGRTTVTDRVSATGSIAARRELPVGVQGEGGLVTAVLVQEGDTVRRGQVMARIDRAVQSQQLEQMRAAVLQAQADAALAQAELVRAQGLVARGFISKADVERRVATRDGANARVAVARAQSGEMRARLERLDIRAPDDGLVLARAVEPGQVVGAGSPALFRVAQQGAMEMRAAVAEQDLVKLTVGQDATVRLVGGVEAFEGQVWLIEPIIDPQARQGVVRVALGRDRRLRPGAFARAEVAVGAVERPLLPQSAVQSTEQGSYVLVVGPDSRIVRREVEVGIVSERGLSINSGLTGRERVVASAGAFLAPGETVIAVLRRQG